MRYNIIGVLLSVLFWRVDLCSNGVEMTASAFEQAANDKDLARLQTCASQLTKLHGVKELAQARWSFSRTDVSKHHPNDGKRDDARSTASSATKRFLPLRSPPTRMDARRLDAFRLLLFALRRRHSFPSHDTTSTGTQPRGMWCATCHSP